ncbi:MAG: recombinase, partial [Pseudomonadota bacterium]
MQSLEPSRALFEIAADMFKRIWDGRLANAKQVRSRLVVKRQRLEENSDAMLERIVDTSDVKISGALEK